MKVIDSILFLITAIVQVDEADTKEVNFIRQKIFERLEKVKTHAHDNSDSQSIAIYLKFHVPETMIRVNALYGESRTAPQFQLPTDLKIACRKHLENLKSHLSEEELKGLIHEAIEADGVVSPQEIVLRDFLYEEISRIYG